MASISTLKKMDVNEKEIHRYLMAKMAKKFYKGVFPQDGLLVTLGGLYTDKHGKLIEESEIWHWLQVGFNPKNIVCVDDTESTVDYNNTNNDPRCKGIQNVFMPLKGSGIVKRGETGGIVKVVKDLRKANKRIAVIAPDLMKSVKIVGSTVTDLAYIMGGQKEECYMLPNFYAVNRGRGVSKDNADEDGRHGGAYSVSDEMWGCKSSPKGTMTELSFRRVANNFGWEQESLRLNGDGGLRYIGSRNSTMETMMLYKVKGKANFVVLEKPKKVKSKKEGQNPNMVLAGKRAYAKRLWNILNKMDKRKKELYAETKAAWKKAAAQTK